MDYEEFRKNVVWGAIFVSILGTILHYVYDWSGRNWLVGFFGATNESTWEHMKMMFWPMFIVAIVLITKWKDYYSGAQTALIVGIKVALWSIPSLFYTYKGILGFEVMWVTISIFYLSIVLAVLFVLHMMKHLSDKDWGLMNIWLRFTLFVEAFAFLWFTYQPPKLGIFVSPI